MNKQLVFLLLFLSSLCCFSQEKESKTVTIDSFGVIINLAIKFISISNQEESQNYAIQAVNYAHKLNNDNAIAEAYSVLANSYLLIKDDKSAEKNFNQAINYGKKSNNHTALIGAYNGLGNIFSEYHKDIDQAIKYYKESSKYCKIAGKPNEAFIALVNIAWTLLDNKQPDKAYSYLVEAEQKLNKFKTQPSLYKSYIQHQFGRYYSQKKNLNKALNHYSRALEIAKEKDLNLELIDIYNSQFQLYKDFGNLNLAIESLKQSQHFEGIHYNIQKNKQIEKIKAQFEIKEVERELDTTNKENLYLEQLSLSNRKAIIASVVAIVLLLISLFLIVYSYSKQKSNYMLKINNNRLLEAKNNAVRLNKLKSKFISKISHELRTPLYGVIGVTSLLIEDKEITSKHKDLINSLEFSGNHLLSLVNNSIEINNIETKKIKLNTKNANLKLLVTNIIGFFKFQAKGRENQLCLNISESVSDSYFFDSLRLSEILMNLIDNANKFTKNGIIELNISIKKTTSLEDFVLFEVCDTGIGISKEDQVLIFDNFNQINKEENIDLGYGLGLPLVKNLIEIMDSKINIESNINKGSKFSFVLPLLKGADTTEKALIIDPNKTIKPNQILIVEDNKISQKITCELIRIIGHETTVANNGKEALDIVKTKKFDLIFMDLNMPIMDGYEATASILKLYPDLNIVGLTANQLSVFYDKCITSGMKDVINKPLSKVELNNSIETYIT